MVQILKVKKKIRKSTRSKSGVVTVQNKELAKYAGKEVIIRIATD
jgi:hypothetical protein